MDKHLMLQEALIHKSSLKLSSVFCAQNTKCLTDRPLMEDSKGPVDARGLSAWKIIANSVLGLGLSLNTVVDLCLKQELACHKP